MPINRDLIRSSLAMLGSRQPKLTSRFYEILFASHPALRKLFVSRTPDEQECRFQEALVTLVEHIHDLSLYEDKLSDLGRRHRTYGVTPEMYPWVAEALLATFAEVAGQDWTPTLERAWAEFLRAILESIRVDDA